jgi:hypothetical protein
MLNEHRSTKSLLRRRFRILAGCVVCVLSLQPCSTFCSPMDCSLPVSSVPGILQTGILEWVAFPPPGDRPDTEIKPASLMSPALAGGLFTTSTTWGALSRMVWYKAQKTRVHCSRRVQEGRAWETPSFLFPPLQPQALTSRVCVCVCVCAHARLVTQSCLTLCRIRDCSPRSSSVHGVIQARILEQVAVSSSRGFF